MKKLALFLTLAVLLILPISVKAAEFLANTDNNQAETLEINKANDSNIYAAGKSVALKTGIGKDFVAAGTDILVDAAVGDDLFAAGKNIGINANIGGSARVVGGRVALISNVSEDFLVAGSEITLSNKSQIGSDFIAAGSNLKLDGKIGGDAKIAGDEVVISGTINGDLIAREVNKLTIKKGAVINGKLTYWSKNEATIESGAEIKGGIEYNKTKTDNYNMVGSKAFSWAGIIYKLLSGIVLLLILVYLFPKPSKKIALDSINNFGPNILWGLVSLIVIPFAVVLLLVFVLTVKIALVLAALYFLYLLLASIYLPIIAGVWSWKLLSKTHEEKVDWLTIIIGVAIAVIISQIKYIGPMALFILFITTLGAMIQATFKAAKQ